MNIQSRPGWVGSQEFEDFWERFREKVNLNDPESFETIDGDEWLTGKVENLKAWMQEALQGR